MRRESEQGRPGPKCRSRPRRRRASARRPGGRRPSGVSGRGLGATRRAMAETRVPSVRPFAELQHGLEGGPEPLVPGITKPGRGVGSIGPRPSVYQSRLRQARVKRPRGGRRRRASFVHPGYPPDRPGVTASPGPVSAAPRARRSRRGTWCRRPSGSVRVKPWSRSRSSRWPTSSAEGVVTRTVCPRCSLRSRQGMARVSGPWLLPSSYQ